MTRLVLVGDSVIDNAAYLAQGEPDVAAQLRERLPRWDIIQRARDGFVTVDVLEDVARDPLPDEAHVFLSAGGNDALSHLSLLSEGEPMTLAGALALVRELRERFRSSYASLLDTLGRHRILAATIYDPRFTGEEARLQPAAEGGLSAFNDVIQQEAIARRIDVLDLRRIFLSTEDYANPIEPSAAGGAKIAAAVAAWCEPD